MEIRFLAKAAKFLRTENPYSAPNGAERVVRAGKDRIGAVHNRIGCCPNPFRCIPDVGKERSKTVNETRPVGAGAGIRGAGRRGRPSRGILHGRATDERLIGPITRRIDAPIGCVSSATGFGIGRHRTIVGEAKAR